MDENQKSRQRLDDSRSSPKSPAEGAAGMLIWFVVPLAIIAILVTFVFLFLRAEEAEAREQTASAPIARHLLPSEPEIIPVVMGQTAKAGAAR
jgi:hypothetical protein